MDYKVTDTELTSIANAIRTKGGTSAQLTFPVDFVTAIGNIPSGGSSTLISKNIVANGIYDPSDDNADGYSEVAVNVPSGAKIYTSIDPTYYMDTTGVICVLDNRSFNKVYSDPAIVAYISSSSPTCSYPVLIGTTPESVVYGTSHDANQFSYELTKTYNGIQYYISGFRYGIGARVSSTSGKAVLLDGNYTFDASGLENAADALMNIAAGYYKITTTGIYNVPSGYDGYGNIEVELGASLVPVLSSINGSNGHVIYNQNAVYDWSSANANDDWKAFDGNKNNYGQYFGENQSNYWIGYEFNEAHYIEYVKFYGDNYSSNDDYEIIVEIQNSAGDWIQVDSFHQKQKNTDAKTVHVNAATKAVRFRSPTLKTSGNNLFIRELEIYGLENTDYEVGDDE